MMKISEAKKGLYIYVCYEMAMSHHKYQLTLPPLASTHHTIILA